MSEWHLRDLTDSDLEEAVALDGSSTTVGQRALSPRQQQPRASRCTRSPSRESYRET